jgi:hypothetical protein
MSMEPLKALPSGVPAGRPRCRCWSSGQRVRAGLAWEESFFAENHNPHT